MYKKRLSIGGTSSLLYGQLCKLFKSSLLYSYKNAAIGKIKTILRL